MALAYATNDSGVDGMIHHFYGLTGFDFITRFSLQRPPTGWTGMSKHFEN